MLDLSTFLPPSHAPPYMDLTASVTPWGTQDQSGIVPRALAEIVRAVDSRRQHGVHSTLQLSYLEVYGNQISDLLRGGAPVGAWHGVAARAVREGATAVRVRRRPNDGRHGFPVSLVRPY